MQEEWYQTTSALSQMARDGTSISGSKHMQSQGAKQPGGRGPLQPGIPTTHKTISKGRGKRPDRFLRWNTHEEEGKMKNGRTYQT